MAVDDRRAPDDGRIAGEAALEEAVPEHDDRVGRRVAVVVRGEQAAEGRPEAEHLEEAARDEVAVAPARSRRPPSGAPRRERARGRPRTTAFLSRKPSNIGCDTGHDRVAVLSDQPEKGPGALITTSRSGRSTGSARSITWSIRLKIAVLAPLPRASVSTTIAAKAGFFQKTRSASFRSWPSPFIRFSPWARPRRARVRHRNSLARAVPAAPGRWPRACSITCGHRCPAGPFDCERPRPASERRRGRLSLRPPRAAACPRTLCPSGAAGSARRSRAYRDRRRRPG